MGYRTPTKSVHWQVKVPIDGEISWSFFFSCRSFHRTFQHLSKAHGCLICGQISPWIFRQDQSSHSWCLRYFTIFHGRKAIANFCPEKCGFMVRVLYTSRRLSKSLVTDGNHCNLHSGSKIQVIWVHSAGMLKWVSPAIVRLFPPNKHHQNSSAKRRDAN